MIRSSIVLLAVVATAAAATAVETVDYRFPTKGLHGIAFAENNVSVAIAVRTREGSEITVRDSVTQKARPITTTVPLKSSDWTRNTTLSPRPVSPHRARGTIPHHAARLRSSCRRNSTSRSG